MMRPRDGPRELHGSEIRPREIMIPEKTTGTDDENYHEINVMRSRPFRARIRRNLFSIT